MGISGVTDEQYLTAIAQMQAANSQQSNVQTSKDKTESDFDSYISSAISSAAAIPSGTYGANGLETDSFTAVTGTDTDSDISAESESAVSGSSGAGGGGGGSSDSEEETVTEIVTINGVTYLQTTTTDENGNETVTRTKIGSAEESGSTSAASAINM